MLRKKTKSEKFINAVCEDFAGEHSKDICEILESGLDAEMTGAFILNVFRCLHNNEAYWAMTQLVTSLYNVTFLFCPSSIVHIQDNDVALIPYCDSLMERLENDVNELNIRLYGEKLLEYDDLLEF